MSQQPIKTVRSDILVHWTGKCIWKYHTNLKQQQRQKYIERLHSILNDGLWMNHVNIDIHHPRFERISFSWPATCFTETKLPDIERHIEYYGLLGFGFTREFVMKRYGGPVLYVAGIKELSKSKGMRSITSRHFHNLFDGISGKLLNSVITCAIFVKTMSDEDCKYPYQRLDEAEWRIPWPTNFPNVDPPMVDVNRPLPLDTIRKNPAALIPFYPRDLRILILPDECTRKMVYDDQEIMDRFGKERPCIKTVEECLNSKNCTK